VPRFGGRFPHDRIVFACMKVLILGATGLLGYSMLRRLACADGIEVVGSVRNLTGSHQIATELRSCLVQVGDLTDITELNFLFRRVQPNVVVNCVAAAKSEWNDLARMVAVFSLLPRGIDWLCARSGARFIQISSDGVFSGSRGGYSEEDIADATDNYGIVKQLGEIARSGSLNIRTSVVGHSLLGNAGLVDWFLAQDAVCRGFVTSIFTGLTNVEIARITEKIILHWPHLEGTYHLASEPISKYDLLKMLARRYSKSIDVVADDSVAINRSLIAEKFRLATGYRPRGWVDLIDELYIENQNNTSTTDRRGTKYVCR
jgi:dTDP-4-dehydrorhamnose reductase